MPINKMNLDKWQIISSIITKSNPNINITPYNFSFI